MVVAREAPRPGAAGARAARPPPPGAAARRAPPPPLPRGRPPRRRELAAARVYSPQREGERVEQHQQPGKQRRRVAPPRPPTPRTPELTAAAGEAPHLPGSLADEVRRLEDLVARLTGAPAPADMLALLRREPLVAAFLRAGAAGAALARALQALPPPAAVALACLPALRQGHVVAAAAGGGGAGAADAALAALAARLAPVDEFYGAVGGLPGYQLTCLRLIAAQQQQQQQQGGAAAGGADEAVLVPVPAVDLRDGAAARRAAAAGLAALPRLAEIYPLGGAGDRLGLVDAETGEALPAAVLPYCGRPLLAALVRDLQAREYLAHRLGGGQPAVPVAVMTSAVKGNHARVEALLEAAGHFGRGRAGFRLFQQPLVPVLAAADGRWLLDPAGDGRGRGAPLLKPGGHGVIWKLMADRGVFEWLEARGAAGALVRQISNPMAGTDATLLALAGAGAARAAALGFASCERVVGAAEGMNVLARRRVAAGPPQQGGGAAYEFRVTNIEYTDFERLGIPDVAAPPSDAGDGEAAADAGAGGVSAFPANTNVLYVGLPAVAAAVAAGAAARAAGALLPGVVFNGAKEAACAARGRVRAGRLECTMQGVADLLGTVLPGVAPAGGGGGGCAPPPAADAAPRLDTFLVHGPRRKVTSSAKRALAAPPAGAPAAAAARALRQTPDGSFYDLMANAADMLAAGGTETPPLGDAAEYLAAGPGFVFLHHPALGPLWEVAAQKVRASRLAPRAEVQLEVAEADVEGLDVDGSLLVLADAPLGHMEEPAGDAADGPRLVYSERCGRVRLRRVRVANAGVDWASPANVWWRADLARAEACRVLLRGRSEFEAADVELRGDVTYDVPDGYRLRLSPAPPGAPPGAPPAASLERLPPGGPPSWRWRYAAAPDGGVRLTMEDPAAPL